MHNDNGEWVKETRYDEDGNWLDVSPERIELTIERMKFVEKWIDCMTCGNYLTHEQRDKIDEAWNRIRSIYYPCVLEPENKK